MNDIIKRWVDKMFNNELNDLRESFDNDIEYVKSILIEADDGDTSPEGIGHNWFICFYQTIKGVARFCSNEMTDFDITNEELEKLIRKNVLWSYKGLTEVNRYIYSLIDSFL